MVGATAVQQSDEMDDNVIKMIKCIVVLIGQYIINNLDFENEYCSRTTRSGGTLYQLHREINSYAIS